MLGELEVLVCAGGKCGPTPGHTIDFTRVRMNTMAEGRIALCQSAWMSLIVARIPALLEETRLSKHHVKRF